MTALSVRPTGGPLAALTVRAGAHLVFVGLWRARPSSPGTSSAGSGRAFGARDGGGDEPTLDGIRSSGSTSGGSEGGRDPLCPSVRASLLPNTTATPSIKTA